MVPTCLFLGVDFWMHLWSLRNSQGGNYLIDLAQFSHNSQPMKFVHQNTNIYPFKDIFEVEKHAKTCKREIESVFYLQGGLPIYSFVDGENFKVWADKEGNLPDDFNPYKRV